MNWWDMFIITIIAFLSLYNCLQYAEKKQLLKSNQYFKNKCERLEKKCEIIIENYNINFDNTKKKVLLSALDEVLQITFNPTFLSDLLLDELLRNKSIEINVFDREPDFKRLNRALGNLENMGVTYKIQQPSLINGATYTIIIYLRSEEDCIF